MIRERNVNTACFINGSLVATMEQIAQLDLSQLAREPTASTAVAINMLTA